MRQAIGLGRPVYGGGIAVRLGPRLLACTAGDLDISAELGAHALPAGSPFESVREARRFAGPLPFTVGHEPETGAIVAINARRTNWQPSPVAVDVGAIAFFDRPPFDRCRPVLAAAFHVRNIPYRWGRGVRYPLPSAAGAIAS